MFISFTFFLVSLHLPCALRKRPLFPPPRATRASKTPEKPAKIVYFYSAAQHQRATCVSLTIWAHPHRQRAPFVDIQPIAKCTAQQKRSDPPIAPLPLLNSDF